MQILQSGPIMELQLLICHVMPWCPKQLLTCCQIQFIYLLCHVHMHRARERGARTP